MNADKPSQPVSMDTPRVSNFARHVSRHRFLYRIVSNCIAAIAIGIVLSVPIAYYFGIVVPGNFRVVTKNVLYRSGQLDEKQLERYVREYKIRSILNLRGENKYDGWYQMEKFFAVRNDIAHYDYAMSSREWFPGWKVDQVLKIMKEAPKPLLIHCQAGADRSGLIAAAWKYAVEGESPKQAAGQLSVFYGHFPFFGSDTVAMDRSFRAYTDYLQSSLAIEKRKRKDPGTLDLAFSNRALSSLNKIASVPPFVIESKTFSDSTLG